MPAIAIPPSVPRTMADANVRTMGVVCERAGPVLYRVALKNGKVILAHLSQELAEAGAEFRESDTLLLEMTPYDFDQARILGPCAE